MKTMEMDQSEADEGEPTDDRWGVWREGLMPMLVVGWLVGGDLEPQLFDTEEQAENVADAILLAHMPQVRALFAYTPRLYYVDRRRWLHQSRLDKQSDAPRLPFNAKRVYAEIAEQLKARRREELAEELELMRKRQARQRPGGASAAWCAAGQQQGL